MKIIIRRGDVSMTVQGEFGERPTITGDLFKEFSAMDLESWCLLFGHWPAHPYMETDFAIACGNVPWLDVEVVEPPYAIPPDGVLY